MAKKDDTTTGGTGADTVAGADGGAKKKELPPKFTATVIDGDGNVSDIKMQPEPKRTGKEHVAELWEKLKRERAPQKFKPASDEIRK